MIRKLLLTSGLLLTLSTPVGAQAPQITEQSIQQAANSGAVQLLDSIMTDRKKWQYKVLSSRISIMPSSAGTAKRNTQLADQVDLILQQAANRYPRIQLVREHDLRRPVDYLIRTHVFGQHVNGKEQSTLRMWVESTRNQKTLARADIPLAPGACLNPAKPGQLNDPKTKTINKAVAGSTRFLAEHIREERGCMGTLPTYVQISTPKNTKTQQPVSFSTLLRQHVDKAVRKQHGINPKNGSTPHYTINSSITPQKHRETENIVMTMWAEDPESQRRLATTTHLLDHAVCTRDLQPRVINNNNAQDFELAARKDIKNILQIIAAERGCMTQLFPTHLKLQTTRAADKQENILFSDKLTQTIQTEIDHSPIFDLDTRQQPHYTISSNVTADEVNGKEVYTLNMWADHRKTGKRLASLHSRLRVKDGQSKPTHISTNVTSLGGLNQKLLDVIQKDRAWRRQVSSTRIVVTHAIDGTTQEVLDLDDTILNNLQTVARQQSGVEVNRLDTETLKNAHYITHHVIVQDKSLGKDFVRLQSWIREHKSGRLLVQAQSIVSTSQLNYKLSKEAEDSPVYPVAPRKNRIYTAQQQLAKTRSPQAYRQAMQAQAIMAEARSDYASKNYTKALQKYRRVSKLPAGKSDSRALAGSYISLLRLGKTSEAQKVFAELVQQGFVQADTLTFKILFAVNSVNFFGGNFLSEQYNDWVKQISGYAAANNTCLSITGHSSNSGSANYNLDLSSRRAKQISTLMNRATPATSGKIETDGKGFNENIVGTGTDDIRDAVDRRVEFKRARCS